MYTVRHVASFVYPAIVVPKGKRLEQRVSMRAPMEYEFTAVEFAEATPNAVVVMTQLRKKDPEIRASYLGWNGRLWRAVEDPETRRPATIDTYLDRLGDPAHQERFRDPFWFGHDRRIWKASDPVLDEANFVGRIVWSDKTDALQRHRSACERLLVVDGVVHQRTDGPVWCYYAQPGIFTPNPNVASFNLRTYQFSLNQFRFYKENIPTTFRMDRFADAAEWAEQRKLRIETRGRIVECDPTFVVRDDLAWALNKELAVDFDSAAPVAMRLPAETVAKWQRLVASVHMLRPFYFEGVSNPATVVEDAAAIVEQLDRECLPISLEYRAEWLRAQLANALDVNDFARSRRWAVEDCASTPDVRGFADIRLRRNPSC
jgi:hypothetical protein